MKKVAEEGTRSAPNVPNRHFILMILLVGALGGFILATVMICSAPVSRGTTIGYRLLASSDMGVHYMQSDYSQYLMFPPTSTLHVQVFTVRAGDAEPEQVTSGITVEYAVNGNTTSANKINFWTNASRYGYTLAPDVGITGNGLSGTCKLSADGKVWEATDIPLTQYSDAPAPANNFQTVTVTVKDTSGTVLVSSNVVVMAVSDQFGCVTCHGTGGGEGPFLNLHDSEIGTNLATVPQACSSCHKDNLLGAPGRSGRPSLSAAVHGFHAGEIGNASCNACHPGSATTYNRGAMAAEGIACTTCHGNLSAMGSGAREAWIDVPTCASCHDSRHQPNAGVPFRASYLNNGPADMDGILCTSCHNSPHAEWVSTNAADNALPQSIYGRSDYIRDCTACHTGSGPVHGLKP